ncbi:MAG TPA: Hsp20/alpha crystallin family protein [Streptosporangiaceae bacterium]|nr:Hsp20/alpha crystallin family protein [Streptosporangiaceae bacterium]
MMSTLVRRDYRNPLAEMIDWLETPWTSLRPVSGHPMRMEDFVRDGSYVIRAELPGIDPDKDLEVTVAGGILRIKAERREERIDKHHSEFHYGTFSRSVTLPTGVDERHVQAIYGHGILEVTIKLAEDKASETARKIPVTQNQHIKAT